MSVPGLRPRIIATPVAFHPQLNSRYGIPCLTDELSKTHSGKFLQETQKLYSDPSIRSIKDQIQAHRLPFQFVVPHQLISSRSDVQEDFLKLCPSTEQGSAYRFPTTKMLFRQPMIFYTIRIKHIRTSKVVENFMMSTYEREIAIMPHTPPAPPLAMEAFPQEYRPSTMRWIRQHRWTRPLGALKLSAAEPSPANVLSSDFRPSTTITLSLTFTPSSTLAFDTTMRVGLSGAALLADQNLLLDSQNGTNTNTLGSPKRSISESPRKEDGAGSSRIRKNVLEKRQQLPMEDPSRRSYQGRKELASDVPQPAFSTSVCGGGSLQYQGIFSQGFRVGLATADHLLPRAKPNA